MLRRIGAFLALLRWCFTPSGARWLAGEISLTWLKALIWVNLVPLVYLQDSVSSGSWRLCKLRTGQLLVTVQLPPEVLAQIFDLLRRRARYGLHRTSHHWWETSTLCNSYHDLRRCQQVCRAWYGPATEALTIHVAPRTREKLLSFVAIKLRRQDELPRVLGLHLPVGVLDYDDWPIGSTSQRSQMQRLAAWLDSEDGPRELSLSVDFSWGSKSFFLPWDDGRVALLSSCTQRVRVLHLTGTFNNMIGELIRLDPRSSLFVSTSFALLETLWLSKLTLEVYDIGPETFPRLRQLQLNDCHADQQFLWPFALACTYLCELSLRDIKFSRSSTQQIAPSLPQIIQHSVRQVTRLTLHATQNLRLGDLRLFESLRYLEVSSLRLPRLGDRHWNDWSGAPPALEVFVVYMLSPSHNPPKRSSLPGGLPSSPDCKLWAEIGVLWKMMQTWKPFAPNLSQLELWDDIGPATWSSWHAISLLFAAALKLFDMHLAVHLKFVHLIA